MRDFAARNGPDLIRQQRHHRHRLAGQGHEFDLVAPTSFMDVNHGADVASLQALGGQVSGEHDTFVFLNHDSKGTP